MSYKSLTALSITALLLSTSAFASINAAKIYLKASIAVKAVYLSAADYSSAPKNLDLNLKSGGTYRLIDWLYTPQDKLSATDSIIEVETSDTNLLTCLDINRTSLVLNNRHDTRIVQRITLNVYNDQLGTHCTQTQ